MMGGMASRPPGRSVKISEDERGGWSSDRPRRDGPQRPPDLTVHCNVLRPADRLRYSPGSLLIVTCANAAEIEAFLTRLIEDKSAVLSLEKVRTLLAGRVPAEELDERAGELLVLRGYGLTIELHGETFVSPKGETSVTFPSTPDVPFESIEVTLPQGRYSEFGANLPESAKYSFCGRKLVMPTIFKAQNGLELRQNTVLGLTGCKKKKTRAQQLAAALKACQKRHGKHQRAVCVAAARKKYGPAPRKKKA